MEIKKVKLATFALDPKVGLKDYSLINSTKGIRLKNILENKSAERDIKSGRTPSKFNEEYWNGDIEFLTMKDIDTSLYTLKKEVEDKITQFAVVNEGTLYKAPANSLIVSNAMTIGLAFIIDRDIYINQNVFWLNVDKDKYNIIFLKWYFNLFLRKSFEKIFSSKYYSKDEYARLLIPDISIEIQNKLVQDILDVEKKISNLRITEKSISEIINDVFAKYFNINIDELRTIENNKVLKKKVNTINLNNRNVRTSFRWNKVEQIQEYLYKNITCIKKLEKYIIETNNGWSPKSLEGGEGIPVLGQEHFSLEGKLTISPTKATEETKKNIENFFIKEGDLFVSRGNTVDLVALANIVEEEISEGIIYPDLYIRIRLNEEIINKKYLALLFNSFIGRLYFKYVSKGKNQSMVKISSEEINNFYAPIPSIEIQKKIVEDIEQEILVQGNIELKIQKHKNDILEMIKKKL